MAYRRWIPRIAVVSSGLSIGATVWKDTANAQTKAITVAPANGSLVVVVIVAFGGSQANHACSGFTKIGGANSGGGYCISMWYKANVSSLTSVTVDGGAGANPVEGIIHEGVGFSTSAPFTSGEFSAGAFASSTNPNTGTVTTATAASCFFAAMTIEDGGTPTMTVNSTGTGPATGFALKSATNSQETDGNNFMPASVPFLIVASTQTNEKHGWTASAAAQGASIIAAFH